MPILKIFPDSVTTLAWDCNPIDEDDPQPIWIQVKAKIDK